MTSSDIPWEKVKYKKDAKPLKFPRDKKGKKKAKIRRVDKWWRV